MYTCVAEALLKTGCVGLSPDAPYTLTSGKTSPVYVDARKILSYPDVRAMVMASLTEKARDLIAHHHIKAREVAVFIQHLRKFKAPLEGIPENR